MKARVLIVDDAPFVREILTQLITREGFEVVGEAQDGEEALQLASKLKPDIIVLDIVLPHRNGISVAGEILRSWPSMYLIATSSGDNPVIIEKAIEAGCADFIAKPFSAESVKRALSKAIETTGARKTS